MTIDLSHINSLHYPQLTETRTSSNGMTIVYCDPAPYMDVEITHPKD